MPLYHERKSFKLAGETDFLLSPELTSQHYSLSGNRPASGALVCPETGHLWNAVNNTLRETTSIVF